MRMHEVAFCSVSNQMMLQKYLIVVTVPNSNRKMQVPCTLVCSIHSIFFSLVNLAIEGQTIATRRVNLYNHRQLPTVHSFTCHNNF